jgi:hypothetical protein
MQEFYLLYYPSVRRLLERITRQPELVEEMVNDTFVVIWRQAGAFRGDWRISTWVFGIAYQRRLTSLRAEIRAQNCQQSAAQAADHINSDFAETTLAADWLQRALLRLCVKQRGSGTDLRPWTVVRGNCDRHAVPGKHRQAPHAVRAPQAPSRPAGIADRLLEANPSR